MLAALKMSYRTTNYLEAELMLSISTAISAGKDTARTMRRCVHREMSLDSQALNKTFLPRLSQNLSDCFALQIR